MTQGLYHLSMMLFYFQEYYNGAVELFKNVRDCQVEVQGNICVTLNILRDPPEIVSLASSGLEKVKQLEHGDAISFNAFSYLQSNCF